jgi:hypothetical protein
VRARALTGARRAGAHEALRAQRQRRNESAPWSGHTFTLAWMAASREPVLAGWMVWGRLPSGLQWTPAVAQSRSSRLSHDTSSRNRQRIIL